VPESEDILHMQRALALAANAVALTSPNPTVGCVLVKDGEVIGEGHHEYDLLDHAEVMALRQAGSAARGATAYVTLEPCSHTGRTGPCTQALIAAGVSRVVIATQDPNPLVRGKGIEQLRAAGIPVDVGVMQQQARKLNDAFAKYITTQQPFVLLKYASSLDGRIAPARGTLAPGERFHVTGKLAHARVHRMRNGSDAILTGIGTVLADDALLTDRSGMPRRRPLLRVVLDSHLRLPLESKLVRSTELGPVLVCYHHASPEKVARLEQAGVQLLRIESNGGMVSPASVLRHLGQQQITSVLVEAGAQLATYMLSGGNLSTVDAVAAFIAPIVMGASAIPLFVSKLGMPLRLRQVASEAVGEDTLLTGYVRDPWPLAIPD
jgi:diaminohydroxyphosphoribosylaminopyrimidine deaminase/5-amino-6-(5-phosphoribosylamino)uracil reductase